MNRVVILILILLTLAGCTSKDWRTASRKSAGIAPNPAVTKEAVLEVYAAPAWGWRGWFAVHTWITAKSTNADSYTVYQAIGWRLHHGLPVVSIEKACPTVTGTAKSPVC